MHHWVAPLSLATMHLLIITSKQSCICCYNSLWRSVHWASLAAMIVVAYSTNSNWKLDNAFNPSLCSCSKLVSELLWSITPAHFVVDGLQSSWLCIYSDSRVQRDIVCESICFCVVGFTGKHLRPCCSIGDFRFCWTFVTNWSGFRLFPATV